MWWLMEAPWYHTHIDESMSEFQQSGTLLFETLKSTSFVLIQYWSDWCMWEGSQHFQKHSLTSLLWLGLGAGWKSYWLEENNHYQVHIYFSQEHSDQKKIYLFSKLSMHSLKKHPKHIWLVNFNEFDWLLTVFASLHVFWSLKKIHNSFKTI